MENEINVRSDEIKEMLGKPPKWIIRWGITVLFAVIGLIFIGSIFFKYPDTIVVPVIITADNPPSIVVARANGKPDRIFIKDNQWVNAGDTLSVIENPAITADIFRLASILQSDYKNDTAFVILQSNKLALGEVQQYFNSYSNALNEYMIFEKHNYHQTKIEALENELKHYDGLLRRLSKISELAYKDLGLTRKEYSRDSIMFSQNMIPPSEYEKSQGVIISKQQSYENARLQIAQNSIAIAKLKQEILDTMEDYIITQKKINESLSNSYNQLSSALATWGKSYILTSPSTGYLTFMSIWSDLQEVSIGDPLFVITPEDIGEIHARLFVPFRGAGKVLPGQLVNIKLDGYYYLEYGMIEGRLASISAGHTQQGYPAVVSLPNGLTTSYGFYVDFNRELHGTAEITTEDLSLLQRLFNPIKHLYKSKIANNK
jgi:multidrug efflux pump subunit AcrA (membrane-fusion protein)